MADASLRAAERVGGVRELVEQLRAGVVSRETVELAAAVGDPVACACLGVEVREIGSSETAERVMGQIAHRQAVWLAVGVARLALPVWEAAYPDDNKPRAAIDAAEAWARSPTGEAAKARAAAAAADEVSWAGVTLTVRLKVGTAARAAWGAARAAAAASVKEVPWAVAWVVARAGRATTWPEVRAALIAQAWRWEEVRRG